jgi:hypothetical protein
MSKVFKAVGKAVTSVVKGVTKAVSSVVKAVVNVVSSVVNFIAQPFMGLLGGMPDAPDAAGEAQRQQGVLLQTQGSDVNIPVVYGYRKVGGAVVFAETGSTNNRFLYVAYVFSEGLVEGLREVFIDDWQLPAALTANLNAGQRITVNADRYKDRVQLQWYPGAYFSNVSQSPVGTTVKTGIFAEAPSFKDTMDFNGLAVLFARYEWKEIKTQEDSDNNPFSGNIPQIQVSLLGKRIASLTSGTPEAVGYDASSVRYSTNPAEILLDYLRNPRYGKGLKNDDIDWTSWKKAAAKCNTQVKYLANSNISGPIMTSNYVLPTDQTIFANVKTLLMGFRAYMPYIGGKYKLKIEDAGNEDDILSGVATIVATFNKDNIQGAITYTGIEKSAKYNVVSVSYVDPDQKWSVQQVIYPETREERQVFIDRDGGRENKLEATFPTLTNYAMAKDMARLLFNKGRRQETCSFTASSQALELEPGDNIRIQSTILNFGTDPWRVVSVKINDNMTVEVACVRNPDDIYPYSRAGEEDIVLPTYIPKGSSIYFPSSENQAPIGLVPPNSALYPTDFVTNPTNPGPTNPAEQSPTNPPADPPPPPPFSAVLRVRSSSVTTVDSNNVIFNVNFVQPDDGLYSYSILWWRYNANSPWVERRIDTLPGFGQDIPFSLGPLPGGNVAAIYQFYVRSFATDGRASSQVLTGKFSSNRSLDSALPGLYEPPGVISAEGWKLPGVETAQVQSYDANIDLFEITPQLSGGLPLNPRRMKVKLAHLSGANALTVAPNFGVSGFTVFYKQKSETYWSYERFQFGADWYPSQVFEANLAGDFGSRAYPTLILDNNSATGQLQQYQFFARLDYKDGVSALKQIKPTLGYVESQVGLYNFKVINSPSNETITADFTNTFLTVDNQPGGAAAEYNQLVASFENINADRSTSVLRFRINPVAKSRFRGFVIRYREVLEGQAPVFNEIKVTGIVNNQILNTIDTTISGGAYSHGKTYDWVVTALYSNSSGVETESEQSLVSRSRVLFSDPEAQNLISKFNFRPQSTSDALGQLKATFPVTSPVNVKNWNKINLSTSGNYKIVGNMTPSYTAPGTSAQVYINRYFECKFQLPSTATALIVYRRVFQPATQFTQFFTNLGPWERVRIPVADFDGPDAEGWSLVRLRGPLSNFSLNTTGYDFPSTSDPNKITGARSYAGSQRSTTVAGQEHQYLFVIEDAGVERNRGLLLTDFFSDDTTTAKLRIGRDAFVEGGVPKVEVPDLTAAYSTPITAGFGKRLDEAVSSVALNKLVDQGFKIPSQNVYNGPYTKFILGLETEQDIF